MADQFSADVQKLVDAGRLPGTGAIIIDKTGKQIYNQSFGQINGADSLNFTNDTQLCVMSCTKLVTSIAVLQLLERGQLISLDEPVSKYLPEQANVKVITGFKDGHAETRPARTEMKIIHLLTHTSGYTYDFWNQLIFDYRISKQQPPGTIFALGADWQFHDVFLEFDPGTRHNYGISVDIAGLMVEKITGMSLPEYVKKNITDPLGMKQTGTGTYFDTDDWLRTHIKSPDGVLTPSEEIVPSRHPDIYAGGNYLVSTLNDYSQVMLTMLNEGKHPKTGVSILSPQTVKDYVFTDFIPKVGCSPDGIGRFGPCLLPGMANERELLAGQKKGWSASCMLNLDDIPGRRHANSGAWVGMANIYYWIDSTGGKAGIFGTSVVPCLDDDCLDLFDKLEQLAYSS